MLNRKFAGSSGSLLALGRDDVVPRGVHGCLDIGTRLLPELL